MTLRANTRFEHGVALIWAIVLMLVVMGVLVAVSMVAMNTVNESRQARSATQGSFWIDAAGNDVLARIRIGEIGPELVDGAAPDADRLVVVPVTRAEIPTRTRFANGMVDDARDYRAFPLAFEGADDEGMRGWYQIIAPPPAPEAIDGALPWTVVERRSATKAGDQGAFDVYIRVWADVANAQSITGRIQIRQSSIARYSLLSQAPMAVGTIDGLSAAGFVHSNNTIGAPSGIVLGPHVLESADLLRVTASKGSVSVAPDLIVSEDEEEAEDEGDGDVNVLSDCTDAVRCLHDVGDTVPFGSGTAAIATARKAARSRGGSAPYCNTQRFVVCDFTAATIPSAVSSVATEMPEFRVNLGASNDCVHVTAQRHAMRSDIGAVPMLDDYVGPTAGSNVVLPGSPFCPAPGGGALVFDGDVVVTGKREADAPPVTIMVERTSDFPARTIGGVSNVPVTVDASIYVLKSGADFVGAASALSPVGLVAQGGVYMPSWAMDAENDELEVRNVAAMAVNGEIGLGPVIQALLADGQSSGRGIDGASAAQLGYGTGTSLTFSGSLASADVMTFRLGSGEEYVGYGSRSISYAPDLAWNPPPWYPALQPWFVADWKEFRAR